MTERDVTLLVTVRVYGDVTDQEAARAVADDKGRSYILLRNREVEIIDVQPGPEAQAAAEAQATETGQLLAGLLERLLGQLQLTPAQRARVPAALRTASPAEAGSGVYGDSVLDAWDARRQGRPHPS